MAMAGKGFHSGGEEIDDHYVTQLQSLMRGYLTRRNLQIAREEYEHIFSEIEGSEKIFVCWPLNSLCLPKTQKDRPVKKECHGSLVVLSNETPVEKDKTQKFEEIVPLVPNNNFDFSISKETNSQEKCTAETQTSFIEDHNLKLSLGSSLISQKTDIEDGDQSVQVQDDMYTFSRENSFTDHSDADRLPHLVEPSCDAFSLRHIHPSSNYDDKSGLPLKSPDSSGGFEHSEKNSGSHSSSGRSQVKSSRTYSERKDGSRSAVNTKRSNTDYEKSAVITTQSNEKSYMSNDSSDQSEPKSNRSEVKSYRSNVSSGQSELKSDRSEIKSNRSNVSSRSGRSGIKSDMSEVKSCRSGVKSDWSDIKSNHSVIKSDRSEVSLPNKEQEDLIDKEPDLMTPGRYMRESSVITNVTSVWDSFSSTTGYIPSPGTITDDPQSLMEMRKNIAMELLWVQQAINSRKNYLKLKDQMKTPVCST
ncbi:uncharacterized protein LOC132544821 [Ylistrum balloti]|uniref:uncharacterized protein LOC132544821 n=1 Tax=Ylistrum balloti TaxID=509963 RepID=UPI00290582CF|nr:uncharacterized protein LOC132544821 [Ylistrum balloti]